MTNYKKLANNLVEKLTKNCNEKTMKENYGQKEIDKLLSKFEREKEYNNLTYSEKCSIKDILNKVDLITPNY